MTITEFIAKWRRSELTERAASQQHFLDLCEVFGHPKPAEVDATGEQFTFERGAAKHGGGRGWADVWKRGFFGWEYKGKHKNLGAAYDQLLKYREALENPPLLVVCDMERFRIHTNFTATVNQIHDIALDELGEPRSVAVLRAVFHDPASLRPQVTVAGVTKEVAERLGRVAQALRGRGLEPTAVARFLDRIVFCLFAEDVGLLPRALFSQIVEKARDPEHFSKLVSQLFDAMRTGGDFGLETIRHFDGSLFTESPVLVLTESEIADVREAAHAHEPLQPAPRVARPRPPPPRRSGLRRLRPRPHTLRRRDSRAPPQTQPRNRTTLTPGARASLPALSAERREQGLR